MREAIKHARRRAALLLCLALLAGCVSRVERAPLREDGQQLRENSAAGDASEAQAGDLSLEHITSHVAFPDGYDLAIARPEDDVTVSAESYYITGVSDPELPLLMDGEPVEARGVLGSFGVFVDLAEGENTFVFSQGDVSRVVRITRAETAPGTTAVVGSMRPAFDAATWAGYDYPLTCTAPSGAKVTARVDGLEIPLEQVATTAVEGVPAGFSGPYVPAARSGTEDLGPVTYILEYGGETTEFQSGGRLFVAGDTLLVRGLGACSTVFVENDDEAGFYTTLLEGGIDTVEEIGGSMYRLGMGGWVFKDAVAPIAENSGYRSSAVDASHTVVDGLDVLTFIGADHVPYRAERGEEGYAITLFHTTGVGEMDVAAGGLLRDITVREEDGHTTLTLLPREGARMGGYLVEYQMDSTRVTLTAPPTPGEGARPLQGVTVMLDPGHGGSDSGADGVAMEYGPKEKEINLATALATQKYLEALGARVLLTREDNDTRVEMDDRQRMMHTPQVDIMVSLHSNSIPKTSDGTGPSGVETYFYEEGSRRLAESLQAAMVERTGRRDRGDKHDYYLITLNSGAPSVLLEMGFITNPVEYDYMCTPQGIYETAQAVAEGIVAALR